MNSASMAIEKLRRIEELWEQLRETKTNTVEYRTIVKQIGVLSMEYHKLAEAAKKPEDSK
jgi:hypothetical protein